MKSLTLRHTIVPAYLAACLLLGGASAAGYFANLALQLAALPLVGWGVWHLLQTGPAPQVRSVVILFGLFVGVALLQLVPLPSAVWTLLPGRESVVEGYGLLGVALPWLPLSLAPAASVASLLWLLPAFAVLLGVVVLGAFRGRSLAAVIILVTLVSVAVGALQVIGGNSAYFYSITNYGVAVGFFANANHNATLLLVCIPFLAALQVTQLKKSGSQRSASAIRLLVGAAAAVIVVGLLINSSLAGIGLGVPVALGSWLTFGRRRTGARRGLGIAAGLVSVIALATIVIGPFGNNLFGQQTGAVELSRQTSFRLTLQAAGQYFPVGSGIGSFVPIYRTQEPLETVTNIYMNHAHSDWLELLLETGIAGILLAIVFLGWWGIQVRKIWQAAEPARFPQAAAIASMAIMLHSIVDYPLRTAALSAVFAACIGLMSGVRPFVRLHKTEASARHLSL